MIRLLDPFALAILASAALSLWLMRAQRPIGSILAALFVVLLGVEAACFDGRQHQTEKFDATFFVWARAVELRALAGLAIALVAAPCGIAAARLAGTGRGALMGLVTLGPFGLGLFASSVALQLAMSTLEQSAPEDRYAQLRLSIDLSTRLLCAGTLTSVLACALVALGVRRRCAAGR